MTQPEVWYSDRRSATFPDLHAKGGIGPMAGPAYQLDERDTRGWNPVAWPERHDGTPLFDEWTRDYVKRFRPEDPDGDRRLRNARDFDGDGSVDSRRPGHDTHGHPQSTATLAARARW